MRELARRKGSGPLVADALERVIQRADELGEFVALYWKEKKQPLSAGSKRGLARAFVKFDAYQLAKYDREAAVKLRDVLFLCHAKPKDAEQAAVWKKLVDNTIESPDTWEVALSAGKDKRENFERLLREGKLGGLAALRNLRLMLAAGVEPKLIRERIEKGVKRALPFRFPPPVLRWRIRISRSTGSPRKTPRRRPITLSRLVPAVRSSYGRSEPVTVPMRLPGILASRSSPAASLPSEK